MVESCRKDLVTLPAAERYHANFQSASSFRLEDSQLEAASPEVATDGGWLFGDWYATIAGWQIFVPGHVHRPFIKRQRRARDSGRGSEPNWHSRGGQE